MDKDITLTRRRIIGSVAAIGAASAAAGAGTFALFNDDESSTDNSVSAGTVNLTSPTTTGSTTLPGNMVPGDLFTLEIETTYDGSVQDVDLNLDARVQPPASESQGSTADIDATQFAEALKISSASISLSGDNSRSATDDLTSSDSPSSPINTDINASDDGSDSGTENTDLSGLDFDDIVDAISGQNDYATLRQNDTITVSISGTLDSNIGNFAQGDGAQLEVAFGVQQSSATNTSPTF